MTSFKTWQIFFFSVIPLALVFAGVIIGSQRGVDASREVFPTPGPPPPIQRTPTPRAQVGPILQFELAYTGVLAGVSALNN